MSNPQLADELATRFDITKPEAARLIGAAYGLWTALHELGWTDPSPSMEFNRVLPEALALIRSEANAHADGSKTEW